MTEYSLGQQAMLVCVDSYEGGVPRGRLYLPGQQGQRFDSLSQLLLRAEQLLEQKCLQYEQNFHSQDQIQDRTLEFRQEDSVIYCDVRYVISGEIGTIREIFIK